MKELPNSFYFHTVIVRWKLDYSNHVSNMYNFNAILRRINKDKVHTMFVGFSLS